MRFATLLHTGSIVKGPIRVKFACETTAPEKTAFPQIRGITYYTLNPVTIYKMAKACGLLFLPWLCSGDHFHTILQQRIRKYHSE